MQHFEPPLIGVFRDESLRHHVLLRSFVENLIEAGKRIVGL